MGVVTGLDELIRSEFASLRGLRVAVLCNQASIDSGYRHLLEWLYPEHSAGRLKVAAIFGPQHGLFGHTQDNMIEWEGSRDERLGIPVFSLYGQHRRPTPEMLQGVERLVVDLPDIGARYYTFAWTMALALEACAESRIPVTILDRPNPIGGVQVEGPVLDPEYASFVGRYPLPTRHGMTLGEIATYLQATFVASLDLTVVRAQGWQRYEYLDETDAPWAMPSPNMPTVDTAAVYPGGCLIEGTNLSEGRGTTRPFEIVGAPYLDGRRLAESLNGLMLPGVYFRPIQFEPTFNKHAGKRCEGIFVHVLNRAGFEPVLAYVAVIREALRQTSLHAVDSNAPVDARFSTESAELALGGFAWKRPPYEYETEKLPIDILAGNDWLREAIEGDAPLSEIRSRMADEAAAFTPTRSSALLY